MDNFIFHISRYITKYIILIVHYSRYFHTNKRYGTKQAIAHRTILIENKHIVQMLFIIRQLK